MELSHFLTNATPGLLQIVLNNLDFDSYAMLIRSCSKFTFLKEILVREIQDRITQNPDIFARDIMGQYLMDYLKSLNLYENEFNCDSINSYEDEFNCDSINIKTSRWIKNIAKCELPLLNEDCHRDMIYHAFMSAISYDDFDTLQILILYASPNNLSFYYDSNTDSKQVNVPIELKNKLHVIVNITQKENYSLYLFLCPLFFLPTFGASQTLMDKVNILFGQLDSFELTHSYIVKQYTESIFGGHGKLCSSKSYGHIRETILRYNPDFLSTFDKINVIF